MEVAICCIAETFVREELLVTLLASGDQAPLNSRIGG
jgi:hypothetical protein